MNQPHTSITKKEQNLRPIIIGAGVCGLAVSWRLHETADRSDDSDNGALILEQEDRPGGLARSITLGDQVADMGPHRIHTEIKEVDEFLGRFAGDQMETVPRQSQMYLRGRWIEYPPKPFQILRLFGPITLAKVLLSFAGNMLPGKDSKKTDSFESVMTSAFGKELYRLIVLDYTRKVWKISPRKIHGDIARVRVSAGGLQQLIKRVFIAEKQGEETALKKFRYLPGGVETLIKGMADHVMEKGTEIRCGEKLIDLYRENDCWNIVTKNRDGVTSTKKSHQVFSTVPVTELCEILLRRTPDEKVAKAIGKCRFIANFLIVLRLNKERQSNNQWLYFPGKETLFNRGYEPKNFSESMGKPGSTLLILEVTCYENDAIWKASDEKLTKRCIRDLKKIGYVKPSEILESSVVRIPHTYPLYDLDYRERTDTVWKYLEQFPGLISVGRQGLFLHNNMDHSIHMGFRASDTARKFSSSEAPIKWYENVREFQQFRIVD